MGVINRRKKSIKVAKSGTNKALYSDAKRVTAGMLLQTVPTGSNPYIGNPSLGAYYNSGITGNYSKGYDGSRDIPPYFLLMNEQNGGLLYFPVNPIEKMEWLRYFARTDPYVSRAMKLRCDLPLSKVTINPPKPHGKLSKKISEDICTFFKYMCEEISLTEKLGEILWELNVIGMAYPFVEYDDKQKIWKKITLLPPEEVDIFKYPFSEESRIEYKPRVITELIKQGEEGYFDLNVDLTEEQKIVYDSIPEEIKESYRKYGYLKLDTNPYEGSFGTALYYNKVPYHDKGYSDLESLFTPLMLREYYKQTQLSLASRNMTPKNVVTAPGLGQAQLDELRMMVDMAQTNPDFAIVTNYEMSWETIGHDNRLLDLNSEYESIENQIFAGLGVTREILTGEGTYSGNRITVEVMNTMFMNVRQRLQKFVEDMLFKPMCEIHGWFDEKEIGGTSIKEYWIPKLGFNRITIRDNAEVFDTLFQLYQKGSLPVNIIYELLGLDSDSIHEKIKDDLFTVKDPKFNEYLDRISSGAFDELGGKTDLAEKLAKYLNLKYDPNSGMGNEEEFGYGEQEEVSSEDDTEQLVEEVLEDIPEDSDLSEEAIQKLVEEKMEE